MTTWNLTDLAVEENILSKDIPSLLEKVNLFKETYKNVFENTETQLLEAIKSYETLLEEVYRLLSFAYLKHTTHLEDDATGKLYQNLMTVYGNVTADLTFFSNGLIKLTSIPQSVLSSSYAYWIEELQKYKAYTLDNSTEAYAAQKSNSSHHAWVRLYDETLDQLPFTLDGETKNLEEVVSQMSDPNEAMRKKAALALSSGLLQQKNTFVRIINTLLQDHRMENSIRGYKSPDEPKHLSNQITKEVVDLLCDTIKENYKNTSHRYYALKAKILGKDKIEYWDRNAPLFPDDKSEISYEEGKTIVFKAYKAFSPTLAELVQKFYDNAWIDVYPRKGKTSGAFSHPTVPSVHPYILLNYQNRLRDVATLAHELGHGAHQILSGPQGLFLSDTPLTIAETASVFGEMLTFESMKSMNPKALLSAKIEDMLNTVVRQIAFYEFEKAIHAHVKDQGEISFQELNDYFIATQKEALGDAVNLDPAIAHYWMYISHFFHSHFYVYAYAFGDCLVNSLYAQYKKCEDKKTFEQQYLAFLSAGGSKPYTELLAPFNLDPRKKSFWEGGLKMITDMIDELEQLI